MAVGANLTSAAGVLSLLKESEDEIKVFALQRLNELVDDFWAEISEDVSEIEELYESQVFPERELSALVASKVYYHLGSFQDSLLYALGAGEKFDVNGNTEYIATIISKCIDHYTALRVQQFDQDQGTAEGRVVMDPRLEAVVDRMFERCLIDRRYKQAVGIALETRRIDILQRAIQESDDILDMLSYTLRVTLSLVSSPKFRDTVLKVLLRSYQELETPDYISVCQCYIFLDNPVGTAQVLEKLARGTKDDTLVAYQIAFDLYESATQHFLRRVQEEIRASLPSPPPSSTPSHNQGGEKLSVPVQETGGGGKSVEWGNDGVESLSVPVQETGGQGEVPVAMETVATGEGTGERESTGTVGEGGEGGESSEGGEGDEGVVLEETKAKGEPRQSTDGGETMDMDVPTTSSSNPASSDGHGTSHDPEPEWMTRLRSVDTILGGEKTVALHQEFLIRNNHTDLQILKKTKEGVRNSVTHSATVMANGLMHFGTTSDVFLRENLDWLKRASNWAKFTATASLGLIHYGHEKEALNLMSSYLPKDSTGSSPYAEGGGLYAIGLIHANHGLHVMDYIVQELKSNNSEIVRHGGCLGLGLAAMGTANLDAYDLLKENLMTRDDAVIGEAAGIAMGLVMIGTHSSMALEDMINYARDTQHEKIQRGLALGVSFLVYGKMEEADTLVEDLCRDKDPLLRRSGVFSIAMAYCGSGDNKAIKRLLHIAVSDVDDDVRRAAVTSLGFLLFRTSEQCPHVVSLLSESFNPHVRCGAAMALGIACAGTGNKEALSLLEPMLTDSVSFVQQAAVVAAAMILIQQSEAMNSKVAFYRQHFAKVIADKHEDTLTKFGAVIAQGIIDAGGRNVTISLQSRTGHMNMKTAVGLLVFSQFWFWYPLCHFLSLALTPTAVIALNADLKMPRIQFRSNAKPSLYAYPPPLEKEKEREKEKVATAVLSVAAKAKAKEKKKAAAAFTAGASGGGQDAMETESIEKSEKNEEDSTAKMDTADNPPEVVKVGEETQGEQQKESAEEMDTTGGSIAAENEERGKKGGEKVEGGKDKETKKGEGGEKEEEKKAESEPDFEILSNPARVLPAQLKVLGWDNECRYHPLKPISVGGIIMLRDRETEKPEELIEPLKVVIPGQEEEEEEPQPPEPFEWTED